MKQNHGQKRDKAAVPEAGLPWLYGERQKCTASRDYDSFREGARKKTRAKKTSIRDVKGIPTTEQLTVFLQLSNYATPLSK